MLRRFCLCLFAVLQIAASAPGESAATPVKADATGPARAAAGAPVAFVFSERVRPSLPSVLRDDVARMAAPLEFGDRDTAALSFSGVSGAQTIGYSPAQPGRASIPHPVAQSVIEQASVPHYGRSCSKGWLRTRCQNYYIGSDSVEIALWTESLTRGGLAIEVGDTPQQGLLSVLPQILEAALPWAATFALFGVGLAGLSLPLRLGLPARWRPKSRSRRRRRYKRRILR